MSQSVTRLNPASLPDSTAIGYSQISIAEPGRLAFISGQVAWTPTSNTVPDGLAEQTTIVLSNARAALEAVGATPHDLVMLRLYVTNLTAERTEEAMPQLLEFLAGAQPSLTGIGVAALASPELQIEMEMVVRLPA